MSRSKKTASKRQRQSDDVVHMEPPPEHQFARFFSRLGDLNHYVFNFHEWKEISPRSTGHAHLQVDDLVIMWAMNNDIKIHWPYFIAHHMLRFTKSDHSKGIGYVCLWTRIFKHLGIAFSNESGRMLAQQHVIDIRALHHMGRNIEREEEEQAPPPQAQEPQEDQAGPSEQPSMRDIMEILQRMEINQQNLSQQIQSLQQEQGRMRRSIRRIEAYTFSEDEDEEQD
ncbi:hypothetical protein PIB30_102515 [Stylosanthes scabra]|uniref:Uncharacterized protein n=1 Tax=Stylosanthes scabra TaxID=79078 RepID=A0ABU6V0B2_9FABA|nr:hypothetical protein [Stylosanthes scabra]